MITKKLKHNFIFDDELKQFHAQFNHVVHYAFNRYADSKGSLKDSVVEQLVKSNMNHIDLLDASFIKQAVLKAKAIYKANKNDDGTCGKVVFGGRYNFLQRSKLNITQEQFHKNVLLPIRCTGSKNDNGNRKFDIDLKNHKIIFKRDKSHHYDILLNSYSKQDRELLFKLQEMHDKNKKSIEFTIEVDEDYVYLVFDEFVFANHDYHGIQSRIASIDLNPNYVALVIQDENQIIDKIVYNVKELNDFDNKKNYASKKNKQQWRSHLNNKKKHEILQISKSIIKSCVHYKVESFVIEDLTIKSKNSGKGKTYNKLCLNHWQRNLLFNNLQKRCHIENIGFYPVYAGYSSIKGQLENDNDVDSIAAAIEIGNRKGKDLKEFGESKVEIGRLSCRWKNEINLYFKQVPSWKEVSEFLKKKFKNSSYRNFFSETSKNIRVSYSLNSQKSHVKLYHFI